MKFFQLPGLPRPHGGLAKTNSSCYYVCNFVRYDAGKFICRSLALVVNFSKKMMQCPSVRLCESMKWTWQSRQLYKFILASLLISLHITAGHRNNTHYQTPTSMQRIVKKVANTPSDLIKAHNFWIGCICSDAPSHFNDLSTYVKKIITLSPHADDATTVRIPNEIDFVLLDAMTMPSEQTLRTWYAKIRPGGMLIGTAQDDALQGVIKKTFGGENAEMCLVNERLWYVQKKHFLSCIVPTYNRAHTLGRAIDSLYKQNLKVPFEVIVTDDASTDDTHTLLCRYQKKYPNLHVYVHDVNGGASKARNTCIAHAQGDLIFNLDSDNYLETQSLQGLIDLLDATGVDIAAFGMIKYFYPVDAIRKQLSHVWTFNFPDNICAYQDIFGTVRTPLGSGNYLFTKKSYERAGGYNGRTAETWRFGYKQLATGSKIAILPKTHYWHSLSPDGKWNRNEMLNKNGSAVFNTFLDYPELLVHDEVFCSTDETNVLARVEKSKLRPVDAEVLPYLFDAYRFAEYGLFVDAVAAYDLAIEKGMQHEHVCKKRAHAASLC